MSETKEQNETPVQNETEKEDALAASSGLSSGGSCISGGRPDDVAASKLEDIILRLERQGFVLPISGITLVGLARQQDPTHIQEYTDALKSVQRSIELTHVEEIQHALNILNGIRNQRATKKQMKDILSKIGLPVSYRNLPRPLNIYSIYCDFVCSFKGGHKNLKYQEELTKIEGRLNETMARVKDFILGISEILEILKPLE